MLITLIRLVMESIDRRKPKNLPGYKPNKHYMRGPGPAWHAKNGTA